MDVTDYQKADETPYTFRFAAFGVLFGGCLRALLGAPILGFLRARLAHSFVSVAHELVERHPVVAALAGSREEVAARHLYRHLQPPQLDAFGAFFR